MKKIVGIIIVSIIVVGGVFAFIQINNKTINEDKNSNEVNSNSTNTANNEDSKNTNANNTNKSIKYEFKSTNETAVLKVYELTDKNLSFEYNSGFDSSKNTIDRNVTGTATKNTEKLYEYAENVSGHQYKIVFEFNDDKDKVTVYEYDDDNELSQINLWNNSTTN